MEVKPGVAQVGEYLVAIKSCSGAQSCPWATLLMVCVCVCVRVLFPLVFLVLLFKMGTARRRVILGGTRMRCKHKYNGLELAYLDWANIQHSHQVILGNGKRSSRHQMGL